MMYPKSFFSLIYQLLVLLAIYSFVAAIALISLAVLVGRISPALPEGMIAFNWIDPRDPQNQPPYVMDMNRAITVRLDWDNTFNAYPAWSPDGSQLAYATSDGLSIFDFRNGKTQTFTGYGIVGLPLWSSDGREVAMQSFMGKLPDGTQGNSIVFLNPGAGGTRHFVTDSPGYFQWIPHQQRIALIHHSFDSDSTEDDNFLIINNDGSVVHSLPDESLSILDKISVSPDGESLLFAAYPATDGSAPSQIYVLHLADGSLVQLTHYPVTAQGYGNSDPQWSPDGKQIVYTSDPQIYTEIYVMNADGSSQRLLSDDPALLNYPAQAFNPIWSPDGKHILFEVVASDYRGLELMDADGQNRHLLVSGTRVSPLEWEAAWRP